MNRLSEQQITKIQPVARTIQLICLALISGVILFAFVFCVLTDWQAVQSNFDNIFAWIAIGFGSILTGASLVLPGIISNSLVSSAKDMTEDVRFSKLIEILQTKTIVQFALLEGGAFACVMMFFISKNLIPLVVAAVLVATMILSFPKMDAATSWIADRLA